MSWVVVCYADGECLGDMLGLRCAVKSYGPFPSKEEAHRYGERFPTREAPHVIYLTDPSIEE